MTSSFSDPSGMDAVEPLMVWVADLLGSAKAYADWVNLEQAERSRWLDDEGYSQAELTQALRLYQSDQHADPALSAALEGLLLQGIEVPEMVIGPLEELLRARLANTQNVGGGGMRFLGEPTGLLHTISAARKLKQQASSTRLGLYVDVLGGLESVAAHHVQQQVEHDKHEAEQLRRDAHAKATEAIQQGSSAYNTDKTHFIDTREDQAIQAEKALIEQNKGTHPLAQWSHQRPTFADLGTKEQTLLRLDGQYFKQHEQATLAADLAGAPIHLYQQGSDGSGGWSVTFDWHGTPEDVNLDRSLAIAELNPALKGLNILTAKALWHARVEQQIAGLHTWTTQLAQSHTKVSGKLGALRTNLFPNATLPKNLSQLKSDKTKLMSRLEARERRAERHGVTLTSLQRRRDEKRLQSNPSFQRLEGYTETLLTIDRHVKHEVRKQLAHLAVKVLIQDLSAEIAANSRAQALILNNAVGINAVRSDLGSADITIDISDKRHDISWSSGQGLTIKKGSKNSHGLSFKFNAAEADHNSLTFSLNESAGVVKWTASRTRDHGMVIRQYGNTFSIQPGWKEQEHQAEKAYKRSLDKAVKASVETAASQHPGLLKNTRLLKLGREIDHHAGMIRAIHHDRQVERKLTRRFGSLRAQKLVIDRARANLAAAHRDVSTTISRLKGLSKHQLRLLELTGLIVRMEWKSGVSTDQQDITIAKKVYKTSPYHIEKNSSGKGYHLERTDSNRDYWQKVSQYNRFAIFNPIYNSENYFYNSEKQAFVAGAGAYMGLRRAGATKRMARLGATAIYFETLLAKDKRDFVDGLHSARLAYAPFVLRRQLHVAKQVVYLNRHHFAWRMRLSWKVKREVFLHGKINAYEQYMLNNKFTGFHPFHRIGRTLKNGVGFVWRYITGPVMRFADHMLDDVVRIFSPSAATWLANANHKAKNADAYLAWHAVKALWHLPEHLYHHTIYFGKQLLFAVTHPWAYRKIWQGLKKDFKGPYKLLKLVWMDVVWTLSVYGRLLYQIGRYATKRGANWQSIFDGAYSQQLHKFATMLGYAWKFSGLAKIIGHTRMTQTAIKVEMVRIHVRRELHRAGFTISPWRRFLKRHQSLKATLISKLDASPAAQFLHQVHQGEAYLNHHWKQYLADYAKMKVNPAYKAQVDAALKADYQKVTTRLGYRFSLLKPKVHHYIHSESQKALNRLAKISNKNRKIKKWTFNAVTLDISEILTARKAYEGLKKRGKKELLVGIKAFEAINKLSKGNTIKTSLQILNSDVDRELRAWHKFFKGNGANSYGYAISHDWACMGMKIGQKIMLTLENSIDNWAVSQQVRHLIVNNDVGKHIFEDIMGGFYLHHYLQLFAQKDPGLIAQASTARSAVAAKFQAIDTVLQQPVVQKLMTHWLKRNPNSLIAKDYMRLASFHQTAKRKIHKWERIERIGTTEITSQELVTLQTLHKNQLLGASFAKLVSGTTKWSDLSLEKRNQYSSQYNNWLEYNQTTHHVIDRAASKFETNDTYEAAAWRSEKQAIESGETVTVGGLLASVQQNDHAINNPKNKNSYWISTPKPPLSRANEHLREAAASIAAFAQDPNLLSVSFAIHAAATHANTTPVKPDPSGLAYIIQIRHWYRRIDGWIKKWKAASEEKKAKLLADADKAKKDANKAKQESETAKQQVKTAEQELKAGEVDQQELVNEAIAKDGSAIEDLAANSNVDKVIKITIGDEEQVARQTLEEIKTGQLEVTGQEIKHTEEMQQLRLQNEEKRFFAEHGQLEEVKHDVQVVSKADAEAQTGDLETVLSSAVQQEIAPIVVQAGEEVAHQAIEDLGSGAVRFVTDGAAQAVEDAEKVVKTGEEIEIQTEKDIGKVTKDIAEAS